MVHAHDLLDLLLDATKPYHIDELRVLVTEKFGEDTRFQNCKERTFSFDELMSFLAERGKIAVSDGLVTPNRDRICRH